MPIAQCRIPLRRVDAGVAARFAAHDCLCLGPPWRPPIRRFRGRRAAGRVARLAEFLAGDDARAGGPLHEPAPPDPRLELFRQWLLRNRGNAEVTASLYLRILRSLLDDIGYDVARYDATLLRDGGCRTRRRRRRGGPTRRGGTRGRRPACAGARAGGWSRCTGRRALCAWNGCAALRRVFRRRPTGTW